MSAHMIHRMKQIQIGTHTLKSGPTINITGRTKNGRVDITLFLDDSEDLVDTLDNLRRDIITAYQEALREQADDDPE